MRKPTALALTLIVLSLVVPLWVVQLKAASVTVSFTFTRVVETHCAEGLGESCPNDYYPKVDIGAQGLDDGKDRFCCAHETDFQPNWVFTRVIEISPNPVPIHVELWDQDDGSADDELDISNSSGRSLDILLDLSSFDCRWAGSGLTGFANIPSSSEGPQTDAARIDFIINVAAPWCVDSDGDSLLDNWETSGYDANLDNTVDVNLPAMGANARRKDLFLEIDFLVAANHTHAPLRNAIQQVVQAFANAPPVNFDGTRGVQLHIDVGTLYGAGAIINVPGTGGVTGSFGDFGGGGNQIAEAGNTIVDWDGAPGSPATDFFTLKNMNANRNNIFRYGLFAHQVNANGENDCKTAGWAKGVPGVNFIVSLGCAVGTQAEQAATLMHEFGHNLGLHHGGADPINNKPNYLSVMNYLWSSNCNVPAYPAAGLPGGCDYSRLNLPAPGIGLKEKSLDECRGIDNGALGLGAVNWNGNRNSNGSPRIEGVTNCQPPDNTNVEMNINNDAFDDQTLHGLDDWNALVYNFRTVANFTTAGAPTDQEPDAETIERARAYLRTLMAPTLSVNKTGPSDARPGDTLSYNIRLQNWGRGPALNVALTDTKPDLTNQVVVLGTVVLGATTNSPIQYLVPCSTTDRAVLTNTVQANGQDLLGNTVTDTHSLQTTIHTPVLELSKTATATVDAGEAISFTITYQNTGSGAAANVVITDTIPAGVYYSTALDQGSGPLPTSVTLSSNGTRTLVWNVGTVADSSGPRVIEFTARPTLLALGGTTYTNNVSLSFTNANGCVYDTLRASAGTGISVAAASRDPLSMGFWRNHPEQHTAEVLARIQATDQRYDGRNGTKPNGALSVPEVAAMLAPGGNMPKVLEMQLLATYFNLATRRVNADTSIRSKLDTLLGLTNVRDAALYGNATLLLPVNSANRGRYSNASTALEEINTNQSLR